MPRATVKRDRFERVVLARMKQLNSQKETAGFRCAGCLQYGEIVKLLCKEHEWMRRLIKAEIKGGLISSGTEFFLRHLLDKLAQRRK